MTRFLSIRKEVPKNRGFFSEGEEVILSQVMDGSGTQRIGANPSGLPPAPEEFLTIPLPPRGQTNRGKKPGAQVPKRDLSNTESASENTTHKRDPRPPRKPRGRAKTPLSPRERQRRKEFAQSLVSAIAINGMVVALLVFTVVHERIPPPPSLFEVTTQPDPEKKSAESSGEAPPTPQINEEAASGAAAPTASMITTTAVQDLSVTPKLHTEFTPSLASLDVMTPSMGASLQSSDFAAAKNQRKKAIKKFIESNGTNGTNGNGIFTIGEEEMRGLISTDEFGDGSGLMLLTDISGSMREIGETVDSYVKRTFPESTSAKIVGCSFKYLSDPVIKEITSTARRGNFTDYVFVCDLQDGEGAGAIGRLRKALITEKRTIRFHVISFDRYPGAQLNSLIMDSGGAFTRVSRTSTPVKP
ncbi:MAG: hypothetical protein P1U85_10380 [Verrucomicrobiales bacterium]|nr:hypothetical protein [Verrucomicrobiales bacterium]